MRISNKVKRAICIIDDIFIGLWGIEAAYNVIYAIILSGVTGSDRASWLVAGLFHMIEIVCIGLLLNIGYIVKITKCLRQALKYKWGRIKSIKILIWYCILGPCALAVITGATGLILDFIFNGSIKYLAIAVLAICATGLVWVAMDYPNKRDTRMFIEYINQ